jgi:hypothetical protein
MDQLPVRLDFRCGWIAIRAVVKPTCLGFGPFGQIAAAMPGKRVMQ